MANSHGVFRSDAIKATKAGNIKSGRFYVTNTPTQIDNGNIVKLDSLISGQRDLWKCVAPGDIAAENLYVIGTPEIIYDESLKSTGALENYYNEADKNITLIPLEVGDTLSVSDECIIPISENGVPTVGSFVTPSATGTKWTEAAESSLTTEVFRGKIIAREIYRGAKYLNVIEMVKVR